VDRQGTAVAVAKHRKGRLVDRQGAVACRVGIVGIGDTDIGDIGIVEVVVGIVEVVVGIVEVAVEVVEVVEVQVDHTVVVAVVVAVLQIQEPPERVESRAAAAADTRVVVHLTSLRRVLMLPELKHLLGGELDLRSASRHSLGQLASS